MFLIALSSEKRRPFREEEQIQGTRGGQGSTQAPATKDVRFKRIRGEERKKEFHSLRGNFRKESSASDFFSTEFKAPPGTIRAAYFELKPS